MATSTEFITRAEHDAVCAELRSDLASLREAFERGTPFGQAQRQDRERRERVARDAAIRALDAEAFISAVASLPPRERAVGLLPADAISKAKSCTGALRQRLVAAMSDTCAAEVTWHFYSPPERVKLTIAPTRTMLTIDQPPGRIRPEDVERAEDVGLRVEYDRGVPSVGEVYRVEGVSYSGCGGFWKVMTPDALAVWRELHPGIERLIAREVLHVEAVTPEESKALSRAEWLDNGAKRSALPPLNLE
ncbi:MAG: hypothetical protein SFX73_25410 [Kofleriaceae bacterium]|nr:hypothetical protein [Kofleriaceae bacterium]